MTTYGTMLTDEGRAALTEAMAGGMQLNLTQFAVSDGEAEVYRASINSISQDADNAPWLKLECVIPANEGGFWLREVGIYTDQGIQFATMSYPETYKPNLSEGLAGDLIIKPILEVTNTNAVTLIIDPSVIMASKQYVDDAVGNIDLSGEIDNHRNELNPHPDLKIGAPIGSMIWHCAIDPPNSYLVCDGTTLEKNDFPELFNVIGQIFGGEGEQFQLPDLRGEFIRGFDNGRKIDDGRAFGKLQTHATEYHRHFVFDGSSITKSPADSDYNNWGRSICSTSFSYKMNGQEGSGIGATGGQSGNVSNETRPRNIALLPCIKYQ